MTNKSRIAELKEEFKENYKSLRFFCMNNQEAKDRLQRLRMNYDFIVDEAELLGRQEQEKEDNRKFAEILDKAKSLAKVYDKDGELYSLIKEKIRELTEGEDK